MSALGRAAKVHAGDLSDMISGRRKASPAMVARLKFAVRMLARGETDMKLIALFRSVLALCCVEMGEDAAAVLATDPDEKRVRSAEWLRRVFVHWMARQVMIDVFGFRQAEVAKALGVTRQAVHKSVLRVLECDEPKVVKALARLDEVLAGDL